MYRPRIGHRRGNRGFSPFTSARPRRNPKSGLKTVQDIERLIESSRNFQEAQQPEYAVRHTFDDFGFPAVVNAAIENCGFSEPTPIQDQAMPLALAGKDLIGIANTGTGKTGAFLLPLITRILRGDVHRVLIMAPTRELAQQISDDFYRFAKGSQLTAVLCIGGTSVRQQIQLLHRPYRFLIGTPGRIKDMASQQQLNLSSFDTVVLDEVDRMLDMGFIHDVRELLSQLPQTRHSLFFSATLPREVENLCTTFSQSPVKISVRTTEYAHTVEQRMVRVEDGKRKIELLYDLLCNQQEFSKVIIFGRTKHGVRRLAEELDRRGFAVDSIHGNKSQAARQRSLDHFKADRISILVATDVAARGIDVSDVTHVINYDVPETIDDYIHRIGRTGRAGNCGIALTLIDNCL